MVQPSSTLFTILCFTVLITTLIEACLMFKPRPIVNKYKMKVNESYPTSGAPYWKRKIFDRRINHETHCVCGEEDDYKFQKNWFVYIHVRINENVTRVCPGTIVTSNLIVTSHQCLTFNGKRMNVYDAWHPNQPHENMVSLHEVNITSKINGKGNVFDIEDIIYNTRFGFTSGSHKFPEHDIVLLKVNYDFTSGETFHLPICLPSSSDHISILHQRGQYQGIGGEDSDPTKENRGVSDAVIFASKECISEGHLGLTTDPADDSICIRFTVAPPQVEGGALRIQNQPDNSGTIRSFLVGIASYVGEKRKWDAGHKYAIFTNIMPLVSYIEYYANMFQSTWCKSPQMQLPSIWPWETESLKETKLERNMSELECTCGLGLCLKGDCINEKEQEFAWLTKVVVTWNGNSDTKTTCAGSIINNKLIVTAAHCMFKDGLGSSSENNETVTTVPAKDESGNGNNKNTVEVFLNPWRSKEEEESVLRRKVSEVIIHPGYMDARKELYVDFDLAILVLDQMIDFNSKGSNRSIFMPVCLPKTDSPSSNVKGQSVTVLGWSNSPSSANDADPEADMIRSTVSIAPTAECARKTSSVVTSTMLCSWTNMDSGGGGPVMTGTSQSGYTLVGVESFDEKVTNSSDGDEENKDSVPVSFYANVAKLLPFIEYHSQRVHANWCSEF